MYLRIARTLEGEIRDQHNAGDWLPSEHALADRFGVNRHTLRRAVDELVAAGVLQRRHGRGTMVIDPTITYPISSSTRFTANLTDLGRQHTSDLLVSETISANDDVRAALGLPRRGMKVVHLMILRSVDETPVILADSYLPIARFANLVEHYRGGSLHSALKQHYGVSPRRSWSRITSELPDDGDASLLRMARNRPLLRVRSLNVDPDDDGPVEYVCSRFRGDAVQLEITPS